MFSHKEQSYLGFDIGTASLKVVELQNDHGRPKLLTYGYMDEGNDIIRSDTEDAKNKIIKAIKLLTEKSRTVSSKVIAALPSYTVFTSIIHLPMMNKREELASAVRWEAKKFVPMPIEEMVLDWKILSDSTEKKSPQKIAASSEVSESSPNSNENDQEVEQTSVYKDENGSPLQRIMITAAPKNLVDRYVEIFKTAGFSLMSLETESLALERSLVGRDRNPILIIDIGASATTILVVEKSVPLINRSIDVGGANMTSAIAESLGMNLERAEQLKRDIGIKTPESGGDIVYPAKLEAMVNALMNEVQYVLNLYQHQSDEKIEKIILTGGSSFLPNLSEALTQRFGIKAYIGDPWARVITPEELKDVLKEIGPSLSISVGLAMHEIC